MVKINCEVSFFYCTKNIKILQRSLENTLELYITNLLKLLYDEAEKPKLQFETKLPKRGKASNFLKFN